PLRGRRTRGRRRGRTGIAGEAEPARESQVARWTPEHLEADAGVDLRLKTGMDAAMTRDARLDGEGRQIGERREAHLDHAVRVGARPGLHEQTRRREVAHDGGKELTADLQLAGQSMLGSMRAALVHAP